MATGTIQPAARIAGHPIHAMLVPIPILCFAGTLITDIVYWRTAEMMWANFSAWLVTVGVVMAVPTAIAGLVDFAVRRRIRAQAPALLHVTGNALVLILSALNAMIHSRDAWTSVVPIGLILSAVVVAIMTFTGVMGVILVHRQNKEMER